MEHEMRKDIDRVKNWKSFLNENINTNYVNLKKQYISNIEDLGDEILIKTPNFEITVLKTNIKQIKQFEEYPKVLDSNVFDFDGYQILDRIIQKSPKIRDFNAFVYFPRINYSFGNETDLRKQGILKSISNTEFTYNEITNDIGVRDYFRFIINNIKSLNEINIDVLDKICRRFCEISWKNATYKPNDIYSSYKVKESKDGFSFSDNVSHYYYDLKRGKNF